MRRVAATIALLGTAVAVMAGMACGTSEDQPPVAIDSVSPASGTIGTEIVITGHGFDPTNNDVGFTIEGRPDAHKAYFSDLASPDGRTIRLRLVEWLGACPESQTHACFGISVPLPRGEIDITVHNQNGTSNPLDFIRELSDLESARSAVYASRDCYDLIRRIDEAELEIWGPGSTFPEP